MIRAILFSSLTLLITASDAIATPNSPAYLNGVAFGKAVKDGATIVSAKENLDEGVLAQSFLSDSEGFADPELYPAPYFLFYEFTIAASKLQTLCAGTVTVPAEFFIRGVPSILYPGRSSDQEEFDESSDINEEDKGPYTPISTPTPLPSPTPTPLAIDPTFHLGNRADFNFTGNEFIAAVKSFPGIQVLNDTLKGPNFFNQLKSRQILSPGNFFDLQQPITITRLSGVTAPAELKITSIDITGIASICSSPQEIPAGLALSTEFLAGFANGFYNAGRVVFQIPPEE